MTSSWSKERFKSDKILKNLKFWNFWQFYEKFSHFLENFLIFWKIWKKFAIFRKFCTFWKIWKKFAFLRIWERFTFFWKFCIFWKNFFKILPCLKCSVLVFCGTLSEILNFFRVFSLLFFTLSEWFLHVICYYDVFMVKRAF